MSEPKICPHGKTENEWCLMCGEWPPSKYQYPPAPRKPPFLFIGFVNVWNPGAIEAARIAEEKNAQMLAEYEKEMEEYKAKCAEIRKLKYAEFKEICARVKAHMEAAK